ncbi:hypothetical protein ACWGH5_14260 [Streptomyces sp. NPDC054864]
MRDCADAGQYLFVVDDKFVQAGTSGSGSGKAEEVLEKTMQLMSGSEGGDDGFGCGPALAELWGRNAGVRRDWSGVTLGSTCGCASTTSSPTASSSWPSTASASA